KVEMPVEVALDAVLVRSRSHVTHCGLRGLLHDFTEFAGECQLAFTGHERRFGRENLSADFRPGKTRDEPDFILFFVAARAEFRNADVLADILRTYLHCLMAFVFHDSSRNFAAD